jgi:hypothetical protein
MQTKLIGYAVLGFFLLLFAGVLWASRRMMFRARDAGKPNWWVSVFSSMDYATNLEMGVFWGCAFLIVIAFVTLNLLPR